MRSNRSLIQLVDGAPGSGKTQVLIYAALYLLMNDTLAFTNHQLRILICSVRNESVNRTASNIMYMLERLDSLARIKLIRFATNGCESNKEISNITVVDRSDARIDEAHVLCTTLADAIHLHRYGMNTNPNHRKFNMTCLYNLF